MYIHYGENKFDYDYLAKTAKCTSARKDKPAGLWASPKDSEYGWKEWCESEDFHTEALRDHFAFELSSKARVLHLHTLEDAKPYLIGAISFGYLIQYELDLFTLYGNYDAIELHIGDDYANFRDNNVFYTWDVDSICVWNPDVVVPVAV